MNNYNACAKADVQITVNTTRLGCIEEYTLTSDRSVSYAGGTYTVGGPIHRLTVTMVCDRGSDENFAIDFNTLNGCTARVYRNGQTVTLSDCTVEKFKESVSLDDLLHVQLTLASVTRSFSRQ